MCRSAPLGMRLRKALSSSGLCFAELKARMARCSRGLAVVTEVLVEVLLARRGKVCAQADETTKSRRDRADEFRKWESIDVLTQR